MELERILRLSQKELTREIAEELKKLSYKPTLQRGFLYAKGSIPVLLIAHLDTVHKKLPSILCYSKDKRFLISPQGIGGDDRAGIYMILEIIKTHKCSVLFCQDEEIGCVGAHAFVKSKIKPQVNYILELDRKGERDAVFYGDNNEGFQAFIHSFGFTTQSGSFSDISVIAPHLGISAVNLSAGYYNPHTLSEYVDLFAIKKNIEKVKEMVSVKTDFYPYTESLYRPFGYGGEISLMNVEEGFVVLSNGYMVEGEDYYIDEGNIVYQYDPVYDCVFEV